MEQVSTIGLDITKHVFLVHGVDAVGAVVVRRELRGAEMGSLNWASRIKPDVVAPHDERLRLRRPGSGGGVEVVPRVRLRRESLN